MKPLRTAWLACLALLAAATAHADDHPDWTQAQKPFRIYGDTYYVGTQGLSAILIGSSKGLVLVDGTLPQNAAQVEANIKALGFQLHDIKLILNSHAHFDHAGAIAAIARDSGARVAASEAGAKELMLGGHDPDDPQFGEASAYPPIPHVDIVADTGVVRVGDVAVTAHYTPGHTPGSTTWTWQSCEGNRCLHMVYADSLGAFTAGSYRYSDPAHPERVANYRHGIAVIAALPCDILMSPHPGQSDFLERVARRDAAGKPDPLIDSGACRAYADDGSRRLDAKLAKEQAGQGARP
ncbi:subclass B3 metallo-beta-lactamase [Dyella telluris]|uniref:Subclass B3 metallo-beta-lactamase n=1 Tax=Dyella telluris TaxID=2763498 RepID=A0A7G8Q778_9GAMM|nr:subclass B3 metallo-beta-lactamase [Dyella telluris]QNK02636.1 subclass B3 metallo-beta-lactamase [Dyella telluris]